MGSVVPEKNGNSKQFSWLGSRTYRLFTAYTFYFILNHLLDVYMLYNFFFFLVGSIGSVFSNMMLC